MIYAALFPHNGKTVAKVLIGKATVPVYYFRISTDDVFVTANLAIDFPDVKFVEPTQFEAEIDYRKNFGEPSDGKFVSTAISKDKLIEHFEKQQEVKAEENPWLTN